MKAHSPKNVIHTFLLACENPWVAGIVAFVVYSALAGTNGSIFSVSELPFFNYLADAFLHGQLHLRLVPDSVHDLIYYQGQHYLYWPPFPAVIFMPFVAVFGINFSDIFFTLVIAALNVSLIAHLLGRFTERGLLHTTPIQRALLVLFFAFGTVHVTIAPLGRVYFTAQLLGFLFLVLAYLAAVDLQGWPAFFWAGFGISAAMLTRNNMIFAGLWPAAYLLWKHRSHSYFRLLAYSFLGLLPIVLGGILFLLYNDVRFGSPLNIGLDYHLMAEEFTNDYVRYGAFHIYYLPTNFFYQYISYPLLNLDNFHMGGSLFLLSPVFIFAFVGIKNILPKWSGVILLTSILLINIPILLLMGTGYIQFGPRYTLDFTVCLLILTAAGIRQLSDQHLGLLTLISVIHYIFGTIVLMRSL